MANNLAGTSRLAEKDKKAAQLRQELPEESDDILTEDQRMDITMAIANEVINREAEFQLNAAREHAERGEVLTEKVIDPHEGRLATVITFWEPLTPSRCDYPKCSFDAAKAIGFAKGWDSINEAMYVGKTSVRDFALEKLAQHKAIKHMIGAPSHIRTAEEAREARSKVPVPTTFIENPRLI